MSRSQKPIQENNRKINDVTADLKSTIQCSSVSQSDKHSRISPLNRQQSKSSKSMLVTNSDGNIIKAQGYSGLKHELVNKVHSWNVKDAKSVQNTSNSVSTCKNNPRQQEGSDLSKEFETLNISPNTSEDNLCKPDWLRARDSLENLLPPRMEKADIPNSKSTSSALTQERLLLNESPCSEPILGAGNLSAAECVSKVLAWDPWDKMGRKNKKESKRRKLEKSTAQCKEEGRQYLLDVDSSHKDHTSGDEVRSKVEEFPVVEVASTNVNIRDAEDIYEYQPYHPQNNRSVEFTNEVMVVYFSGDEVVAEATEPLKKEFDQQIRNKEMRKGYSPAIIFGKTKLTEDYIAAWFKK